MGFHAAAEDEVQQGAKDRALAEHRVLKVRGSYDAPGFEACVKAEIDNIRRKRGEK